MSLDLVLVALVLATLSGLPGLFLSPRSRRGERLAAGGMTLAALAGLAGAALRLAGKSAPDRTLPWAAAGYPPLGMDALSAFFLVPVFLMGGLGALYGLGYWPQRRHPANGARLRAAWGLTAAGMGLILVSRHALAFLLGWELMALSAFFLITADDHLAESRRAGWIYLAATHVSTLALFAFFLLWRQATGSFLLAPPAAPLAPVTAATLFGLALLGFGIKAGLMPFHFWLPGAHANAPSHVSALMSGVVLKMGIYGLVRFLTLVPDPPPAWGGILLFAGAASGLLGILFAIAQADLKRLLAYSSVENIGIILMGLGLALLGRSMHQPGWVVLGLAGALLHVWNHALFKSLLFLGAGAVLHGAQTRQIDRMGGLAKAMPWTAACFLAGAVAICGLPPMNGFAGEWLLYLGLLKTLPGPGVGAAFAVPALAMIGALAVAAFVKVYGIAFLGEPRSESARHAHEAPLAMRLPMVLLAGLCALIGLAPLLVAPALDAAVAGWQSDAGAGVATLAPLSYLGMTGLALAAAAAAATLLLGRIGGAPRRGPTWDCGYIRPTARMQYTGTAFSELLTALFHPLLRPTLHRPTVRGLFPASTQTRSQIDDAVLDLLVLLLGSRVGDRLNGFRRFQQGLTQHYVLYILLALLALAAALLPFTPTPAPTPAASTRNEAAP